MLWATAWAAEISWCHQTLGGALSAQTIVTTCMGGWFSVER